MSPMVSVGLAAALFWIIREKIVLKSGKFKNTSTFVVRLSSFSKSSSQIGFSGADSATSGLFFVEHFRRMESNEVTTAVMTKFEFKFVFDLDLIFFCL